MDSHLCLVSLRSDCSQRLLDHSQPLYSNVKEKIDKTQVFNFRSQNLDIIFRSFRFM